jgi:hypothetical protein
MLAIFSCLAAAPAFAGSFNILGGYVVPSQDSVVFTQNETETTFEKSDLNDFGITFGYDHFLSEYINLGGSISYYRGRTAVDDLDFIFDDGFPVHRHIRLEIVPIELNLRFLPAGRDAAVIPYFGGGAGLYYWQYEEEGDFVINRNTPSPQVITGLATSDGTDPGWHLEGGVYIPVAQSIAIAGEVKYWKAHGDLDEHGFDPSFEPIDLSGTMFTGGVSFWF